MEKITLSIVHLSKLAYFKAVFFKELKFLQKLKEPFQLITYGFQFPYRTYIQVLIIRTSLQKTLITNPPLPQSSNK